MWPFLKGATSKSIDLYLVKLSDGTPMPGLAFNTAGLVMWWHVPGGAAPTQIALATQTVAGAWASAGFVELDPTGLKTPGGYRFDIPNAILDLAIGAVVYLWISGAGVRPQPIALQLKGYDEYVGVALDPVAVRAALGMAAANLDTQLTAIAGYVDTEVLPPAIRAALGLAAANLDTQLAAINALEAAVKTKTDQLIFTKAGELDVNTQSMNGVTVNGAGTPLNPWGP